MSLAKGALLELTISDLAFEGVGISKIKIHEKDFVIFVENVAPGDVIEAEITKIKKNHAIARKTREITPSACRINPRCKHFGFCGGCTWQFLNYEDQIVRKENFVREALERIGGIKNPPVEKIIGCQNPWFYRNKMEYTFSNTPKGLVLGFHMRRRFADVFDVEECYLESELSVKIAQWVKEWAKSHHLLAYDPQEKRGFLRNLVIREARTAGERMVNLFTASDDFPQREDFTKKIMRAFPREVTSLYWTVVKIKKGFRTTINENFLAGKEVLTEILRVPSPSHDGLLTLVFDIAAQAFFQPNTKQAEILYGAILAMAEPKSDNIVVDLFCGTGTIGVFFAKVVKKVFGIEINESAVESARQNAEKNGLMNIAFFCGDAGKEIKKISEKPDILVVDPPRAGLSQKTTEKILEWKPKKIIYVSCNPTTLARDLKILTQCYKLKRVQPIDLFPQTYHVESVTALEVLTPFVL